MAYCTGSNKSKFVHNRCGGRVQGFELREVKLEKCECGLCECGLCQPTVLHPLSREKGYPAGDLPLVPPAAQRGWLGVSHTGGSSCISLTHSKPGAGSCFSSPCRLSSPSSRCPVPLQGSCHAQGPACAHLSSPCQTTSSSREKVFFYSAMDFTTHPVLLPMDVPKLWLWFPCVAITACLCFVVKGVIP